MRERAELLLVAFERRWLADAFDVDGVVEMRLRLHRLRSLASDGCAESRHVLVLLLSATCCWSASGGPTLLPTAASVLQTPPPELGPWLRCSSSLSSGFVGTHVGLNFLGFCEGRF